MRKTLDNSPEYTARLTVEHETFGCLGGAIQAQRATSPAPFVVQKGFLSVSCCSDNFVCVRYSSGWQYDNNAGWLSFTPVNSDTLVASVNFDADTVNALDIYPSPITSDCQSGNCLDFDGDGDYVDIRGTPRVPGDSESLTLNFWIRITGTSTAQGFIGQGNPQDDF